MIRYDIFVDCNWVATRWQQYSTQYTVNNTQNDTKQTMYRTTQKLEKQNSYTLLLTNFILSADVLSKNVTAFYIQSLLVYILY